jgi:hypothetical protein
MKSILLALVFLFVFSASAQQVVVYFAKGDVIALNGVEKVKVNEGLELNEKSILKLGDDGMVVLLEKEHAVLLKEAGEYSYAEILKRFEQTKRSVSDRYITYIWNQAHADDESIEDAADEKMGVTGMVSRGQGGVKAPEDSVIVINESFTIEFTDEVVPGYLFIYEMKKPISHFEVDSIFHETKYGGVLETGKWYGFAASANNQAPLTGIRYFKWASDIEKQDIQIEMAKILADIEEYPSKVKDDIIQAYLSANRYIYYVSKE